MKWVRLGLDGGDGAFGVGDVKPPIGYGDPWRGLGLGWLVGGFGS